MLQRQSVLSARTAARIRERTRKRRDAGYTLLELLVVMGILTLLTAVATPQIMGYFGKAKAQSAQVQIQNISTALELYYMENGVYPSSSAGLKALVEAPADTPNWNGPYLKKVQNLLDPWGHPYQYVYPTAKGDYEVYSLGADGTAGRGVRKLSTNRSDKAVAGNASAWRG